MVTINQLADIVAETAGIRIVKKHIPGPQGVRGRNSDNTRLREVLNWEPQISLEEGLAQTYAWIEDQIRAKLGLQPSLVRVPNGSQPNGTFRQYEDFEPKVLK
jgi:hypothetical protein